MFSGFFKWSSRRVFIDMNQATRSSRFFISRSLIGEWKMGSHCAHFKLTFRVSFPENVKCAHSVNTWRGVLLWLERSPDLSDSIFGSCIRSEKAFRDGICGPHHLCHLLQKARIPGTLTRHRHPCLHTFFTESSVETWVRNKEDSSETRLVNNQTVDRK